MDLSGGAGFYFSPEFAQECFSFISQKWGKSKTSFTSLLADKDQGWLKAAPMWLPMFYCEMHEVMAPWESH